MAVARAVVADSVFFYGTLMTGFERRRRAGIESKLHNRRRGWISAALFDLGLYPAAIPAPDSRVWGEIYDTDEPDAVLAVLDDIEGFSPGDPDHSLYVRRRVSVTLDDGRVQDAWVYFYNAPLGRAPRIRSGDYLQHVGVR